MRKIILWGVGLAFTLVLCAALMLGFCFVIITPNLPALDELRDYKPKIPLRIYSADQVLIGEFGQERREFIPIKAMPDQMKQAILAIEDARFYQHPGIDMIGVMRAVFSVITSGHLSQGGSTITMQVARDFFLTKEKLKLRKLYEVMLAYKIESELSKDQILELYMNQIYLGQRAYGFGSAANIYFGKPLAELSVAQSALLAGLPKSPSLRNPVVDPDYAKHRAQVVLKRMQDVGYITAAQYQAAKGEPLQLRPAKSVTSHAQYVAEMARIAMVEQFKEEAYTRGISVITTINKAEQDVAWESVQRNVLAYDQRHGYRGPEAVLEADQSHQAAINARPYIENLPAAVVLAVAPKKVRVALLGQEVEISGEGLRFASSWINNKKLKPGAIIRLLKDRKGQWQISQLPEVSAAFVVLDAKTGAYRALVGGFDYELSKLNHVTQAWRQPGSTMKPFIYSAAIEKGIGPGSQIDDTPLSIANGSNTWSPQNDDNVYDGAVSLRTGLAKSKNVVAVRVLQSIGMQYGREFLPRFGFDLAKQPENLTLALGTGSVTPLQMAGAYAVFANGGHAIKPYLIQKVVDQRGKVWFEAQPGAQENERVLDARNAFLIDQMLREVVRSGTGAQASQKLQRRDLAGKTGTTSEAVDGWFAGYSGNTVGVAWIGYDEPKSLGGREFGATLSLPIWIDYMRAALAGKPEQTRPVPAGVSNNGQDWVYDEFAQPNPAAQPASAN
ncbi:MAG: mrcA [Pseudomonadota bacterium]|jgi:penicillin-binding protein 1A